MSITTDPNDDRLGRGVDEKPIPQKTCSRCSATKALVQFSMSTKDGVRRPNSWCKQCSSLHMKLKYASLTPDGLKRKLESNESRRQNNMRRIHAHLASNPCVDCGEADPVVLEFDHVRGEKRAQVSDLASTSWGAVLREIAKCDVRCANCHARRTHRQLGYRNYGVDQ